MTEKIKDPSISWKGALQLLDSDPRYCFRSCVYIGSKLYRFRTNHLLRDDKDRIFKDHLKVLYENRLKEFKALLTVLQHSFGASLYIAVANLWQQETKLDITLDWKHAKDLLRNDKRYFVVVFVFGLLKLLRYSRVSSERDKATIFERHIRDVRRVARIEFQELLQDTKQINHATPLEGPQMDLIKSSIRVCFFSSHLPASISNIKLTE